MSVDWIEVQQKAAHTAPWAVTMAIPDKLQSL